LVDRFGIILDSAGQGTWGEIVRLLGAL
jgi:hypothetical protein